MRLTWWVCLAVLVFLALASPALGNAGIPMIVLAWPSAVILILPIVLLEAAIMCLLLSLQYRRAVVVAAAANFVSTSLGIPLTWGILLGVELVMTGGRALGLDTVMGKLAAVTIQSAWLIPYEESLHWMIPAAGMFLCVPFFLASVGLEYITAKWMLTGEQPARIKQWSWRANAVSYSLVLLVLLGVAIHAVSSHGWE